MLIRVLLILSLVVQPSLAAWMPAPCCPGRGEAAGCCASPGAAGDQGTPEAGCCGGETEDVSCCGGEDVPEQPREQGDGPGCGLSPWCGVCRVLCRAMTGAQEQTVPEQRAGVPKPAETDPTRAAVPFWAVWPRASENRTWVPVAAAWPPMAVRARLCVWVI